MKITCNLFLICWLFCSARRRLAESESSCDEEEPVAGQSHALPTSPALPTRPPALPTPLPALPTPQPALPTPPPALRMPPSVMAMRQSQVPPTPPQVLQAASSEDPHLSRNQEGKQTMVKYCALCTYFQFCQMYGN